MNNGAITYWDPALQVGPAIRHDPRPHETFMTIALSEPAYSRPVTTQQWVEELILSRYPPPPQPDPFALLTEREIAYLLGPDEPTPQQTQTTPRPQEGKETSAASSTDEDSPDAPAPAPSRTTSQSTGQSRRDRSMMFWSEFFFGSPPTPSSSGNPGRPYVSPIDRLYFDGLPHAPAATPDWT